MNRNFKNFRDKPFDDVTLHNKYEVYKNKIKLKVREQSGKQEFPQNYKPMKNKAALLQLSHNLKRPPEKLAGQSINLDEM